MCHAASCNDILELKKQTDLSLYRLFFLDLLNASWNWVLPCLMVIALQLQMFMICVFDKAALVCGIAVIRWVFEPECHLFVCGYIHIGPDGILHKMYEFHCIE